MAFKHPNSKFAARAVMRWPAKSRAFFLFFFFLWRLFGFGVLEEREREETTWKRTVNGKGLEGMGGRKKI